MHFSTFTTASLPSLLLAGTASAAVNIRFYFDSTSCASGNYGQCTAAPSGSCCSPPASSVPASGWQSLGFVDIPTGAAIEARAYTGEGCRNSGYLTQRSTAGQTQICFPPVRQFESAQYRTVSGSARRDDGADGEEAGVERCAKPDVLGFADGSHVSLQGLIEEDMAVFVAGGNSADVVAQLEAVRS
ncbi:hypothetical protein Micbo1qcDRAFT_209416 [Microdochium bolleyi]|uniref:Uncharacterized protein n=1 Tax=Microdochium bolleyi TaxID=196109 RepID=A0A136IM49_9PEZI|nr:hypothetical protein Micbo1qcDRAFT_209416 [Microdochium bolleyi]